MNEKETLLKAEAYCSAGERCRSEVLAKIRVWDKSEEMTPEAVGRVLQHLEKDGYLDEKRYAAAFVHDKLEFCRWGRVKIRAALRQKGVLQDAADAALDGIDEDGYREILRAVIDSRRRDVRGASDYERSMKLLRFAAQRGFEPAIASEIIRIQDWD